MNNMSHVLLQYRNSISPSKPGICPYKQVSFVSLTPLTILSFWLQL